MSIIAAAAGRMLWQQAYQVDYLASSIISHFWRSRKRRQRVDKALILHNLYKRNEIQPMQACCRVLLAEDAVVILHACMARAVWRQGYVIDYAAASIIAHNWRKIKRKRAADNSDLSDSKDCAVAQPLGPESTSRVHETATSLTAADDDAAENVLQFNAENVASSLLPTRKPSSASKKTFGALLRASRTGELRKLLCSLPEEKGFHPADPTSDVQIRAKREALVVSSFQSVVGDFEVLPNEIVIELLMHSGVFISSAATVMAEHLKATSPSLAFSVTAALKKHPCLFHTPAFTVFLQLLDTNHDGNVRSAPLKTLRFQ